MQQQWPLIVADFRREYQIDSSDLAAMYADDFQWLLQGLSADARFMRAWSAAPKNLYDPADIEAVTAAARR